MNEEEKKAIDKLNAIKVSGDKEIIYNFEAGIILNLIEKQNKELEDYKSRKIYQAHLIEIANKMIDEMAEAIKCGYDIPCLLKDCEDNGGISCENCIKEYFRKKVENG